jgi:hypothetical protein
MTDPSHGVHIDRDRRDRHDDRNVDFETLTQATLRVDDAVTTGWQDGSLNSCDTSAGL